MGSGRNKGKLELIKVSRKPQALIGTSFSFSTLLCLPFPWWHSPEEKAGHLFHGPAVETPGEGSRRNRKSMGLAASHDKQGSQQVSHRLVPCSRLQSLPSEVLLLHFHLLRLMSVVSVVYAHLKSCREWNSGNRNFFIA